MMSKPKVNEILIFLEEWRSSDEVKKRYSMNSREWSRYSRWLIKSGLVESFSVRVEGHQNRVYLYKSRAE